MPGQLKEDKGEEEKSVDPNLGSNELLDIWKPLGGTQTIEFAWEETHKTWFWPHFNQS